MYIHRHSILIYSDFLIIERDFLWLDVVVRSFQPAAGQSFCTWSWMQRFRYSSSNPLTNMKFSLHLVWTTSKYLGCSWFQHVLGKLESILRLSWMALTQTVSCSSWLKEWLQEKARLWGAEPGLQSVQCGTLVALVVYVCLSHDQDPDIILLDLRTPLVLCHKAWCDPVCICV